MKYDKPECCNCGEPPELFWDVDMTYWCKSCAEYFKLEGVNGMFDDEYDRFGSRIL